MNFIQIKEKFEQSGPFDAVLATDTLAESEGYGEKGMRCTVTGVGYDEQVEMLYVNFDYTKFVQFNTPRESRDYEGGKTATEAGMNVSDEQMYLLETDDDAIVTVDDNDTLFGEYLQSGQTGYTKWLEAQLKKERSKSLSLIVGHDDDYGYGHRAQRFYDPDMPFQAQVEKVLEQLTYDDCLYICNTVDQLRGWNK